MKTIREMLEKLYNAETGTEMGEKQSVDLALKEIAEIIEGMRGTVKLCGKGYDSCDACPYSDQDCDSKKYYYQAITDIATLIRSEEKGA